MVEGLAFVTRMDDATDDVVEIPEHFAGGDPKDGETARLQIGVAMLISNRPITVIVRLAVDLNRKAAIEANEIEDEFAQGVLPPKLVIARTLSQFAPDEHFREVARASLAFGNLPGGGARVENPSTTRRCRAVPLPVPGRYWLCPAHIRNTPKRAPSSIGALSVAAKARPNTSRVCAGSMMPSSHRRAVA
ncbi:hypothetical protein SPAN111604_08880 [Sphingomonas antarctica]